jgi:hypothetical protein
LDTRHAEVRELIDQARGTTLRKRENALFDRLESERPFKGKLYRDGIPSPDVYLSVLLGALISDNAFESTLLR